MGNHETSADLRYRTSSFCSNGGCVEVALAGDFVAVRDSKDTTKPALRYSAEEWQQFVAGVKNGEFDL
jgi:hypothetical protein